MSHHWTVGRILLGVVTALSVLLAVQNCASAQITATIVTTNNAAAGKAIWITIYDLAKTRHLDYGCVRGNGERDWASGTYLYGSFYYVRAEVKANADCGGKTLCDTTVRVNPQTPGPVIPGGSGWTIFSGTKVTLLPNGNNCYWRHDN